MDRGEDGGLLGLDLRAGDELAPGDGDGGLGGDVSAGEGLGDGDV